MKKKIKIAVYANGDFIRNTQVTANDNSDFWDEVKEKLFARFNDSSIGGFRVELSFNPTAKVLSINSPDNFD